MPAPSADAIKPKVEIFIEDNFKLEGNYAGTKLFLLYPDDNHSGSIQLKEEDAKKMHEALKVRGGKKSYYKFGRHITCSPQRCTMEIDYNSGSVIQVRAKVKASKIAEEFYSEYESENLSLDPKTKIAKIILTEADAKALYKSMDVPVTELVTSEANFDRKVNEIDCLRNTQTDEYRCELNLDFETGEMQRPL